MVHFTPLTVRGKSNSPYSIYDQLSFDPANFPNGEQDLATMIDNMESEHALLGMTDVVWNHTANNSKWLEEHPEAGYNVETAPWLESALALDDALLEYGERLEALGLPTEFKTIGDLAKVIEAMKEHVIGRIRLWEYYAIDTKRDAKAIVEAYVAGEVKLPSRGFGDLGIGGLDAIKSWSLKQKADFLQEKGLIHGLRIDGRYCRQVDAGVGAALLTAILGRYDAMAEISVAEGKIKSVLDELNLPFYREYDADVAVIMQQVKDRVRYLRIDDNGPKLGRVTKEHPFIESYFSRLPLNDMTRKHSPKALALVNNGWIWAADAMKDNAGPDWQPSLRREIIVWSDCVKLRYGTKPSDNPFLWDFMGKYTRLHAKYFAGFRIDNCHSTPLHVAEHLLDEARKVRPDLAVFAELFTGSEEADYVFVKRLGLSALIREAMQAWGTGELSRLVHMHGGRPIGSFELNIPNDSRRSSVSDLANRSQPGVGETVKLIRQTPVHALFMDCTHDNEMPAQKRDARDTLPNAALVNMCASASGSVMGYDEIYPRLVEIVQEKRLYSSRYSDGLVNVGSGEGIGGVKKLLNQIHTMMGKDGYDETHIHHEGEYITVHRVHPESRKGFFLIAHTAFPGYGYGNGGFSPVHLTGTKAKPLGSWMLEVDASDEAKAKAVADKDFLIGLPGRVKDLRGLAMDVNANDTTIKIPDKFPPGSVAPWS